MNSNPATSRAIPQIAGSPFDIARAMHGSASIVLAGFGAAPTPPDFFRPGVNFVPASIAPSDVLTAHARRRRILRWIGAAAFLAVQFTAITYWWFASAEQDSRVAAARRAGWHVTSVMANGVKVRLEPAPVASPQAAKPSAASTAQQAPEIFVALGSALPSGERLQATAPDRKAYVTDTSTVFVRNL